MVKEDFLNFVWKNQLLEVSKLTTVCGKNIVVHHPGQYTQLAGPDFFNAQITIDNQKWAGNVEVHVNASDWYIHQHEEDVKYHNVILHLVWNYDVDVYQSNQQPIPVLVLKDAIPPEVFKKYQNLMVPKKWIFCENSLSNVPEVIKSKWLETLYFERLQLKSAPILVSLENSNHNWEAVLFFELAKGFGLNTNGLAFYEIAKMITWETLQKEISHLKHLEALLFGVAGLLNNSFQDQYAKEIYHTWQYLQAKYPHLQTITSTVEFFKHRPDNFPTIRLAQFASLFYHQPFLFSKIIQSIETSSSLKLLQVEVSDYWKTHYTFDHESKWSRKKTSASFSELLLVNVLFPIYYCYQNYLGKQEEHWIEVLEQIAPEKNHIVERFHALKLECKNVMDSQAVIQLKNNYCDHKKCLQCGIGQKILRHT